MEGREAFRAVHVYALAVLPFSPTAPLSFYALLGFKTLVGGEWVGDHWIF